MSRPRAETFRGPIRWLSGAAIFALAPKCLVCLAAYAGAGAALGVKLGGPEFCGGSPGPSDGPIAWLALVGAGVGVILFRRLAPHHRD